MPTLLLLLGAASRLVPLVLLLRGVAGSAMDTLRFDFRGTDRGCSVSGRWVLSILQCPFPPVGARFSAQFTARFRLYRVSLLLFKRLRHSSQLQRSNPDPSSSPGTAASPSPPGSSSVFLLPRAASSARATATPAAAATGTMRWGRWLSA
jgi:hypothetical protein